MNYIKVVLKYSVINGVFMSILGQLAMITMLVCGDRLSDFTFDMVYASAIFLMIFQLILLTRKLYNAKYTITIFLMATYSLISLIICLICFLCFSGIFFYITNKEGYHYYEDMGGGIMLYLLVRGTITKESIVFIGVLFIKPIIAVIKKIINLRKKI